MRQRQRAPYPVPLEEEGTQACAGKDTDTFFPPSGITGDPLEAIKTICRDCPFHFPCLAFALDRPSLGGIWGGTTERDRNGMRRNRRAS